MHEKLLINRLPKYLTVDNVRIKTTSGIEERSNQFVAFVKDTAPTEVSLGEQVKTDDGQNAVFTSFEEARKSVIQSLERSTYPPDFLNPLKYTKDNISEIMHKHLAFYIVINKDEIETVFGIMTECVYSVSLEPGRFTIVTKGGKKRRPHFLELKAIRRA
jgi:hypothetical protein